MRRRDKVFFTAREEPNPPDTRLLVASFKIFLRATGVSHSQVAHELQISPGIVLGWLYGTIEPGKPALLAIKCFLEKKGSGHLQTVQQNDPSNQEQIKWHSFLS
jgi:hypothetical protein